MGSWGYGTIAPAPLPLFLPNRQEINRLNTDWQESDICQGTQSIIQENGQNLYSSDIERVASLLGDEHGRIQEITNNLYFMQSGSDMPEHQGAVDGGKSLSEPASFLRSASRHFILHAQLLIQPLITLYPSLPFTSHQSMPPMPPQRDRQPYHHLRRMNRLLS
jgi:hypothetical protein